MQDNSQGPVLSEDFLAGMMRQSMTVDVTDLMEEKVVQEPVIRQTQAASLTAKESVAGPVDKTVLLEVFDSEIELVEAEAQATSAAIAAAEEEDVVGWAMAIVRWMQQRGNTEAIPLIQLQQGLEISMVEVWMGLLLSQEQPFEMEQREEFYSLNGIWLRKSYG